MNIYCWVSENEIGCNINDKVFVSRKKDGSFDNTINWGNENGLFFIKIFENKIYPYIIKQGIN